MIFKCCTQYASKLGKLSSGHRTQKGQFSFQSQRKAMPKNGQTTAHTHNAVISHASKVMLKILQARLQQYVNHEFIDVHAKFRKGRGTRDQIANIQWIIEKAREFQKNLYFCFIDYTKAFDCIDHNKLENSYRDGNTRPPDLHPEISVHRSIKKQQLELDMEQQTGSKLGKEYIKGVRCYLAYLTSVQITS